MELIAPKLLAYLSEGVIRIVRESAIGDAALGRLYDATAAIQRELEGAHGIPFTLIDGRGLGPRAAAASVHIVVGGTGAGKTTFARQLQREVGALWLGIDPWLQNLYGADKPDDADHTWYMERIARVEAQMREVGEQLLGQGSALVLDLGFTLREHRASFLRWAAAQRKRARIWYLDVDTEERWQRTQARNAERGATWTLDVTREMFDFMEARFEAPTADEGEVVLVREVRGAVV